MTAETIKTFFTYLTALILIVGSLALIYLTRADLAATEIRLLLAGFVGAATQFLFSERVAERAASSASPTTSTPSRRRPSNLGDDGP